MPSAPIGCAEVEEDGIAAALDAIRPAATRSVTPYANLASDAGWGAASSAPAPNSFCR